MKTLKNNFPIILFILFEITVGFLLLVNPETFTRTVIICFGIILLAIGIIYLLRYLHAAKELGEKDYPTLIFSIVCLIIGCICAFVSSFVIGIFAVIAIIYGILLLISGVLKFQNYRETKKAGLTTSVITLLSAVLSMILGIVIVVNPFTATDFLWIFAGISLLAEAVLDCVALVWAVKTDR